MEKIAIGKHVLPPLPYAYDALEPIISRKAMEIHHDVLHRQTVVSLNKTEVSVFDAIKNNDFSTMKLLEDNLAFYGSSHILHSIYWSVMKPLNKKVNLDDVLVKEIEASFVSFDGFKESMKQAAMNVEGSGWAVLGWSPSWKRLVILKAQIHQNSCQWGVIPILVIDSFEHAFYLDYFSDKGKYIDNWWQLANWEEVSKRLEQAKRGELLLEMI